MLHEAYAPERPGPLRLARLTYGLKQSELAELAGITRTQLGRIETGRCRPRRATVQALAWALDCEADDLFPTDDDPAGNGVAEKERGHVAPREAY